MNTPLIFELSSRGRKGYSLPKCDVPARLLDQTLGAANLREKDASLPEVAENEIVRHYIRLSVMNHHIDKAIYPLGSCTMKYNPKVNEVTAALPGFTQLHPFQPAHSVQGALQLMYELARMLAEISGMDKVTLQPTSGAQGEYCGLKLAKAHFDRIGQKRESVLFPDSAHGTNPASVTMAGFQPVQVKSNDRGILDPAALEDVLDDRIAVLMLTNPNTLGLFEREILRLTEMVHGKGGLVYMDGANLNALMGITRAGDMGFDMLHFNLHKTLSAPHGGGGPGGGAVGVKRLLEPYLPVPVIAREKGNGEYCFDWDRPYSIGRLHTFYGNFGVMVRAYTYLLMMGSAGLRQIAEVAITNANYLKERLKERYDLPYDTVCQHEFVLSGDRQKKQGVRVVDIAKRILDFGIHAPTTYFPLIVSEALMIEPTETESKASLDQFVEVMFQIADEVEKNPDLVRSAPHNTPVGRLNEAAAARELNVNFSD
ncbi:MAG: aminomethyl-transferring glycine dehydrogenase subunit GcvPB [candidate division Zixibacteria bacterium]|nr:aminomethyl-transferring glycine dehydrogenase subunit GcvPB [candidate division Zixibacteria bacterium]